MDELTQAHDLAEQGDIDAAYKIADKHLKEDPNNAQWLMVMCYVMLSAHKPTVAYQLAKRITQLKPKNAGGWLNLGMAASDLWRTEEALRFNKRGLKFSTDPKQASMLCINTASALIDTGRFQEAEKYCKQAIEHNPEGTKGFANLGFCQLAQRKWREGWKNYHKTIGCEWRPRQQYNDEPEWDGKSKGTICVYADQGLGDVISSGSIIPDLTKWAKENDSRIVLDVDRRLAGLFRRSFDATVYGTRGAKELSWRKEDTKIDYSIPFMQLGEYFRNEDEDFPGTAYLTPDPDRVVQWRALFKSKKKPVIGICWSGGIERTGARYRKVGLEKMLPIMEAVDAHYVSLQYLPAGKEIEAFKKKHPNIDITEYRHGTITQDYDDTVALVAALDMVIGPHTTVHHAAGGLGVPSWVLVPKNSQWRYGQDYEDLPWANSIKLIRQTDRGEWGKDINRIAEDLHALYPRIPKATAKTTRQGKLRSDRPKVRANGQPNGRQAGNRPSA